MECNDDGGLSRQARRFLHQAEAAVNANPELSAEPIDLERIVQIRAETRAAYEPASQRAISRHNLSIETETIGGIVCDRIRANEPAVRRSDQLLFYVFGGAFIQGSPFEDLPIIGSLAEDTGLTVVAPRYRLAPEHPAPAAFSDVVAAYDGLIAQARAPVVLAGESAGGNLALLLGQYLRDTRRPLPRALALLSPAVDLRTDPDLFGPTIDADPTLHHQRVHDVARAYLGTRSADDAAVSPVFGELGGLPPTFISTGSRDLLMAMCLRLNRKLIRARVEVECRVWDSMWHVFEFYDDYPEQAESLTEMSRFINNRL